MRLMLPSYQLSVSEAHFQQVYGFNKWTDSKIKPNLDYFGFVGAEEKQTKAREAARYAWEGAKKKPERSLETFLCYHGHAPTMAYKLKAASGASRALVCSVSAPP